MKDYAFGCVREIGPVMVCRCLDFLVNLGTLVAVKVLPLTSGCHGYLWQKSSSDVMVASEHCPLSGGLTGTDQWGWGAAGSRGFWDRADGFMWGRGWLVVLGWVSMIGGSKEGGVSDLWLILGLGPEVVGLDPGHDSLTPNPWPLTFLWSRNTTGVSGGLATSCRVLSGRGGVDGARRWERGQGAASGRSGEGCCCPEIFFFSRLNISNQSKPFNKHDHPITSLLKTEGTCQSITVQITEKMIQRLFNHRSIHLIQVQTLSCPR